MQKRFFFFIYTTVFILNTNAQKPIAAYLFNNSNNFDIAGSNIHLESCGTTFFTADANGNSNNAMQFNGGYFDAGDNLDFYGNTMTIAFWMKQNVSTGAWWVALINKWDSANNGYYIGINPDNNCLRFNIFLDQFDDPTPLPSGQWVHFVASYDGNSMRLFRNGELAIEKSVTGNLAGNDKPFRIGAQSDALSRPFLGSIDEVLIYDEALTNQQILDIYEQGFVQKSVDLAMVSLDTKNYFPLSNTPEIKGKILNVGTDTITEFDLFWSDGFNVFDYQISNINIAPFDDFEFVHPDNFSIALGESKDINCWIENPNNTIDEDTLNNQITQSILGVDFIPEKKVLLEEGTSGICSYCPYGITGIKYMDTNFAESFIAVSFHDNDPMEIPNFDFNFGTLPSAKLDGIETIYSRQEEIKTASLLRLKDFPLASIDEFVTGVSQIVAF